MNTGRVGRIQNKARCQRSIVSRQGRNVCYGKAHQLVDGINGSKITLTFSFNFELSLKTFAANHFSIVNAQVVRAVIP